MIFLYQARVIPLQLQKLFAKLLLLNQDSISTTDLTDSFGWAGNEVFRMSPTKKKILVYQVLYFYSSPITLM